MRERGREIKKGKRRKGIERKREIPNNLIRFTFSFEWPASFKERAALLLPRRCAWGIFPALGMRRKEMERHGSSNGHVMCMFILGERVDAEGICGQGEGNPSNTCHWKKIFPPKKKELTCSSPSSFLPFFSHRLRSDDFQPPEDDAMEDVMVQYFRQEASSETERERAREMCVRVCLMRIFAMWNNVWLGAR